MDGTIKEKYESGKQKLNLSSVHLNQLIQDTINAVKTLAAEKNLNIKLKIPNSMFIAKCDEDLILQVMNNLLANAIKFSNTNQDIIVSLNTNYNEIEIAVQDFGKGIDPLLHKSIFDKFFQAKNQTLRKPEGTGLGLAICKKIIDLHGGTTHFRMGCEISRNRSCATSPCANYQNIYQRHLPSLLLKR